MRTTVLLIVPLCVCAGVLARAHSVDTPGPSARSQGQPATLRVTIDIKPGDEPTTMDPRSRGMLPVALLSSAEFDAVAIDTTTVRFGATGKEATAVRSMQEDVNRDGRVDTMFLFRMPETGIACGHTSASMTGVTRSGTAFEGSETFTTPECK
jgi:hypothetical protein